MSRIYIIGIIFVIMVLNIPFVRDSTVANIQIHRPQAEATIRQWHDKLAPAMVSIITDLTAKTTINGKIIDAVINNTPVDTSDDWSLQHKNSITADQFDAILREYNSPATGLGAPITIYAQSKGIDTAYILYMFIHESTAGTKGVAVHTHGSGNIKCTDENCYEGFQVYPDWETGFKAHIDLLAYYRDTLRDKDIITALERWAPASENNQAKNCEEQQALNQALSYPCGLMINVKKWRKLNELQPKAATTIEYAAMVTQQASRLLPADKEVVSASLNLVGTCMADTVPNALLPSIGLQTFSIPPGEDWSFNEQWIIVDKDNHYCSGVIYGGVCDMASQYQIVARQLGLERTYGRHAGGLYNIAYDDTVVIWSDGKRGGQDLIITNKTNKTAQFRASIENSALVVSAWLE